MRPIPHHTLPVSKLACHCSRYYMKNILYILSLTALSYTGQSIQSADTVVADATESCDRSKDRSEYHTTQDSVFIATFFQNSNDWIITGTGKASDQKNIPDFAYDGEFEAGDAARFYIRKGDVIYKKTNFSPQGELHLISFKQFHAPVFDCKEQSKLPLTAELHYESAADPGSQKILRNLPFAKRGYMFKNKELADYYYSQPWYIPDPSYQSKMSDLTEAEQEWVTRWDD